MLPWAEAIDSLAEQSGFAGVISVDRGGWHDGTVMLEGSDAGVSFRSVHDPASALTRTVIANSSAGAWP